MQSPKRKMQMQFQKKVKYKCSPKSDFVILDCICICIRTIYNSGANSRKIHWAIRSVIFLPSLYFSVTSCDTESVS